MRGHKAHLARLRKLGGSGPVRLVGKALFTGGERIAVEAQISITTGAVSGKNHVASKPGEAPNNDLGDLAGGIEVVHKAPLLVEVSSNAPHAKIEWDWGDVAARPYMRPARDKKKGEVVALVDAAMAEAVSRSRSNDKG